jgi:hypothetical protein
MNPLAEIRDRLTKYPQFQVEEAPDHITAWPTDSAGFPVPANPTIDPGARTSL